MGRDLQEESLAGEQLLRREFLATPQRTLQKGKTLENESLFFVESGVLLRSVNLPGGKRAILDILLPGDMGGFARIVLADAWEISAATSVTYRTITVEKLQQLMANEAIIFAVLSEMAQTRLRTEQRLAAAQALPAFKRVCVALVDIYERLRREELVTRPTFTLPLTQEQLADYLGLTVVHVNRMLRRLREERLAVVRHHVVMITDLRRLREVADGAYIGVCSNDQLEELWGPLNGGDDAGSTPRMVPIRVAGRGS